MAATVLSLTVKIVRKLAGQTGFHVLPHRWVAERTFAWINRCRRTVRDYELPGDRDNSHYPEVLVIPS